MKIKHDADRIEVFRGVSILDGQPIVPHPESRVPGKEVQLDRIRIGYERAESGQWVVRTWSISGEGRALTQNGALSQRRWSGRLPFLLDRPQYAWLRKLVDDLRPEGDLALPDAATL